MASPERLPAHLVDTARALADQAHRLGFFPLVSYLERLTAGAARVGGAGPVLEERIRFRHDPSLAFNAGDVSDVALREVPARVDEPATGTRPLFEVTTAFLGLTGAASPLPPYLAEEVAQEDPDRPARREFLDLFHHRLLSLLYRLEAKYHVSSELTPSIDDAWSRRVLALAGFDTYDQSPPSTLPTWQLLRLLPLLATRARTAERLELALEDVLGDALEGARVTVQQFVGRRVDIGESRRWCLGRVNNELARDTLLGGWANDRAGKFQIAIAPLPPRTYKRLLPGGDLLVRVRELVALFNREPFEYTLELGLTESVTQTFRISTTAPSELGRDTWLGANRQNRLSVQASL